MNNVLIAGALTTFALAVVPEPRPRSDTAELQSLVESHHVEARNVETPKIQQSQRTEATETDKGLVRTLVSNNNVEISPTASGENFFSLGDISVLPLHVTSGALSVRYISGSVDVEVQRVRQTFSGEKVPVTFSFTGSDFTLSVTGSPNNTGTATVNPPNISFTAPDLDTGDTWAPQVNRSSPSASVTINFEDDLTSN